MKLSAPFVSLDAHKQFDDVSGGLVERVYSRWLSHSYLDRPSIIAPDLLERMPEVSPDKLSDRFTLRTGVRCRDDPCFPGGQGA